MRRRLLQLWEKVDSDVGKNGQPEEKTKAENSERVAFQLRPRRRDVRTGVIVPVSRQLRELRELHSPFGDSAAGPLPLRPKPPPPDCQSAHGSISNKK
jgi:hypothetical protein